MDKKIEDENFVSVIIPCYNAEKYIGEAIESVLNQTHTNFELLIINDGSSDNSEHVIKKYQQEDPRIHYYFQSNQGVATARNLGLKHSSGTLIAFLDSDDAWEQENLEVKVKFLIANKDVHWAYSDMNLIDNEGKTTCILQTDSDENILLKLLLRTGEAFHAPSGIVLKRECFFKYGLEFDSNATPSEDLDICIQMTARGFQGKRIPISLWKYRIVQGSLSRNINKLETGNLYVMKKAAKGKLYPSFWFRRKCYANTHFILAGCWWIDGNKPLKGMIHLLKAAVYYPPILSRFFSRFVKIKHRKL